MFIVSYVSPAIRIMDRFDCPTRASSRAWWKVRGVYLAWILMIFFSNNWAPKPGISWPKLNQNIISPFVFLGQQIYPPNHKKVLSSENANTKFCFHYYQIFKLHFKIRKKKIQQNLFTNWIKYKSSNFKKKNLQFHWVLLKIFYHN